MENRKYDAKSIVEAGLIAAIIIVLMLVTGYVPMISFMGTLLLPVPVALLYIRHDLKITLTAIVVSAIITATLFNPIQALLSAISFGLTGLTLGYSIRKNKSSTYILILMGLASLIVTILTTVLTIVMIQKSPVIQFVTKTVNEACEAFKQSFEITKSFYSKAGMTSEQLALFDQFTNIINPDLLMNTIAAGLIMQAALSAFLNYIVAKAVLRRLGYTLQRIKPFTEFYINSFVGALVVLPVPLGIYLQEKGIAVGKPLLLSGQLIMQVVFTVIGISVAVYFLRRRFKLQKGFIVLIILFTAVNQLFSIMYMVIGLTDMMFDFRKINPNRILRR